MCHASLLPRWRGAAPIERAIEAGDRKTGITIMQMDAGLDTGSIVAATEIPIDGSETAGSLTAKLSATAARQQYLCAVVVALVVVVSADNGELATDWARLRDDDLRPGT